MDEQNQTNQGAENMPTEQNQTQQNHRTFHLFL